MINVELLISFLDAAGQASEWQSVELGADTALSITFQVDQLENPFVKRNNFSKTVSLPMTPHNRQIFKAIERLDSANEFNYLVKNKFILNYDGNIFERGYFKVESVVDTYDLVLFGELGGIFNILNQKDDNLFSSDFRVKNLFYGGENANLFEHAVTYNSVGQLILEPLPATFTDWGMTSFTGTLTNKTAAALTYALTYQGLYKDFSSDKMGSVFSREITPVNWDSYTDNWYANNIYEANFKASVDDAGNLTEHERTLITITSDNAQKYTYTGEFRSYYQKPAMRVEFIINSILDKIKSLGYDIWIDWTGFFNSGNPYFNDLWLILPNYALENTNVNSHNQNDDFRVSPTSISDTGNGGTYTITVTADDANWTVDASTQSWCTVTKASNTTATVILTQNSTTSRRNTTLAFRWGTTSAYVSVSQDYVNQQPTELTIIPYSIYVLYNATRSIIINVSNVVGTLQFEYDNYNNQYDPYLTITKLSNTQLRVDTRSTANWPGVNPYIEVYVYLFTETQNVGRLLNLLINWSNRDALYPDPATTTAAAMNFTLPEPSIESVAPVVPVVPLIRDLTIWSNNTTTSGYNNFGYGLPSPNRTQLQVGGNVLDINLRFKLIKIVKTGSQSFTYQDCHSQNMRFTAKLTVVFQDGSNTVINLIPEFSQDFNAPLTTMLIDPTTTVGQRLPVNMGETSVELKTRENAGTPTVSTDFVNGTIYNFYQDTTLIVESGNPVQIIRLSLEVRGMTGWTDRRGIYQSYVNQSDLKVQIQNEDSIVRLISVFDPSEPSEHPDFYCSPPSVYLDFDRTEEYYGSVNAPAGRYDAWQFDQSTICPWVHLWKNGRNTGYILTVDQNNGVRRECEVTLRVDNLLTKLLVIQGGKPAIDFLDVSPTNFNVAADFNNDPVLNFNVSADDPSAWSINENGNWNGQDGASWIHCFKVTNSVGSIIVDPNIDSSTGQLSTVPRSAIANVLYRGGRRPIYINQAGFTPPPENPDQALKRSGMMVNFGGDSTHTAIFGSNITCYEFLIAFCKMFNLIMYFNAQLNRFEIHTIASFYGTYMFSSTQDFNVTDITNKVHIDRLIESQITPFDFRYGVLKYKDSDTPNIKAYKERYFKDYGAFTFDNGTEFSKESRDLLKSPFSATVLKQDASTYYTSRYALPYDNYASSDNKLLLETNNEGDNLYLAFFRGLQNMRDVVPSVMVDTVIPDTLGYVITDDTNVMSVEDMYCWYEAIPEEDRGILRPYDYFFTNKINVFTQEFPLSNGQRLSLLFGKPAEVYNITETSGEWNNGQGITIYENFWKSIIEDRFNRNNRVVRVTIEIGGFDYNQIMRKIVMIKRTLFIVSKATVNINRNTIDLELLKINDINNYASKFIIQQ